MCEWNSLTSVECDSAVASGRFTHRHHGLGRPNAQGLAVHELFAVSRGPRKHRSCFPSGRLKLQRYVALSKRLKRCTSASGIASSFMFVSSPIRSGSYRINFSDIGTSPILCCEVVMYAVASPLAVQTK